jgi:plastocyanin
MQAAFRGLVAGLAAGLSLAVSAAAQQTHVVRLIVNQSKDEYRFEPATVTVHPNDLVVFRVASGAPHSVVFERAGLSPDVRGAFNAVMPGRSAELSSPLLTAAGDEFRMVVPRVPAGSYGFYCLPHRAYDMRGTLTVE